MSGYADELVVGELADSELLPERIDATAEYEDETAMAPLSVLVLAPFLTKRQAGAAHATISIINSLHRRANVSVHVVALEIEPGVLSASVPFTIAPMPPERRFVWRVGRWFRVGDFAQSLRSVQLPRADVIYTQWMEMGLAYRQLDASRPVVSHLGHVLAGREALEESDLTQPWQALDAVIANRVELQAYRSRNWTQVVSTQLVAKARQEHFGLPDNFFQVQPLGINVERFSDRRARNAVRARLGLQPDDCAIISVARMVPWKNLDWLIRAMESLPVSCHLILVGDGPAREALEHSIPQSLASRVHVVGHVDPVPYLAAADIFALPSAIESFGVAYAEAMAMGLPCIGLRYEPPLHLSSAEDVVTGGDSGFVVSSEAELRAQLLDLALDVNKRKATGERARQRALTLFSEDAYASFLEGLVYQLTSDSPTPVQA